MLNNGKLKEKVIYLEADKTTLSFELQSTDAKYDSGFSSWTKLEGELHTEINDLKQGYAKQYKDNFDNALAQLLVFSPRGMPRHDM